MSAAVTVLLFYKYVRIDDPAAVVIGQRGLCHALSLKGRILIAHEGINGTVAGPEASLAQYKQALRSDPRFTDIEFKESPGIAETFPRLRVKLRKEIVTLGLENDVHPNEGGTHLTPQQWKDVLQSDPNVVLFDARNAYESAVGKFRDAIAPPIENFRDLPAALPSYADLKNRKVLMYCTGGVRCEKASALFRREGFQNVFQLHGGILNFLKQFPGAPEWEGECFVFDERMTDPEARSGSTVGVCAHTGEPTSHFVNCLHDPCHRLFLVAEPALAENPERKLCPECLAAGLTTQTADYKGSPVRPPRAPGTSRRSRKKRERRALNQTKQPA